MSFLITEYFFKTVPEEKSLSVIEKMNNFYRLISLNPLLSKLPKGFWIKKIASSDFLYEFRVNNGDRIFFKMGKNSEIIFLIFSSHDRAIRKAKRKEILESRLKEFVVFDDEENIESVAEEFFNYNNMITYEVVDDEEILKNFKDKKYSYYHLNDEQYSCLTEFPPHFIAGSAGSGKSTVTIRKLLNLEENKEVYNLSNILYLTSNSYLCDKSQEQYESFRKKGEKLAKFLTLKKIFSQELDIPMKSIVEFNGFKTFLRNSYPQLKKYHLMSEEIYSEINGILKGLMIDKRPDNWDRDRKKILLDREEYFSLNSNYTTLNREDRELIYSIAERYNAWLKENNFYDLNDLARKTLEKEEKKYDFLIIDEVQDMTELQIYSIVNLLKNKDNIFIAGDIHQMINSTFFTFERVKNLFFSKYKKRLNLKILSKNYRSAEKIVDIANYFSEYRAKVIGSMGENDYKESSILKEGKVVLTERNNRLLHSLQNDVESAIVVPDEYTKDELGYSLNNRHRIFTIQEIKGLEYNNIICYNLSSNYKKQWDKIFSEQVKYDQKYRRYFNIFYVGITRARENLIIMEEEIEGNRLLQSLKSFLTPVKEVIIEEKKRDESIDKKEWLEEGIKLYKLEQFEEAQYAFEKAGHPTWILEAEIEEEIANNNYKIALKKMENPQIQSKLNIYRKKIVDSCLERESFVEALEFNERFNFSYREKEIKKGILEIFKKETPTKEILKKVITIFRKKNELKYIADIYLNLGNYEKSLEFYYNLNNSEGIYLSRKGILCNRFENVENIEEKIKKLNDVILDKNINSFNKKDRLNAIQRALILEKDALLVEMILILGGRLDSIVKGELSVPLYCLKYMNFSKEKDIEFIELFKKYGFDYNKDDYFSIYFKEIKLIKKLINYKVIDIALLEEKLDRLEGIMEKESNKKRFIIGIRKSALFRKIIKNTKKIVIGGF